MGRRRLHPVLLGVMLLLLPACHSGRALVKEMKLRPYAQVWRSVELPKTEIHRIAILPMVSRAPVHPVEAGEELLCSFCGEPVAEHHNFSKAGERISSYLDQALRKVAPYEIVPPEKVYSTLAVEEVSPERYGDLVFLKEIGRELNVDVLVVGEVLKIRERQGGDYSVVEPATVEFRLTLVRVKDGRELFKIDYEETQRSLNEEPQRLFHPSKIRFRWQTADELAQAAIREVVRTFPRVQPSP